MNLTFFFADLFGFDRYVSNRDGHVNLCTLDPKSYGHGTPPKKKKNTHTKPMSSFLTICFHAVSSAGLS